MYAATVSGAAGSGTLNPAGDKNQEIAPLPETLKQAMIKLMSDGAELERGWLQRIEGGRPRRPQNAQVPEGTPREHRDLADRYRYNRFVSINASRHIP
jgi:hypothetical protein